MTTDTLTPAHTHRKTRAVVLVSGGGSNLQAFIDQVQNGELDLDLCLVISNVPSAYGLERAEKAGIENDCINHKDFNDRLSFDQALMRRIDQANPDLIILAGFMRILTPEFVNHYADKLLNIHPSLLPKFTGTNTHQRAIDAGEEWHGVSVHYVIAELDAGPIIAQGRLRIKSDDDANSLQQRIHKIEHQLYPLAVKWFSEHRLTIRGGQVLLDGETSSQQLQSFDL